jgi:hypothetical protein
MGFGAEAAGGAGGSLAQLVLQVERADSFAMEGEFPVLLVNLHSLLLSSAPAGTATAAARGHTIDTILQRDLF